MFFRMKGATLKDRRFVNCPYLKRNKAWFEEGGGLEPPLVVKRGYYLFGLLWLDIRASIGPRGTLEVGRSRRQILHRSSYQVWLGS